MSYNSNGDDFSTAENYVREIDIPTVYRVDIVNWLQLANFPISI